ncbi:type II toxin-antitoxin system RelE/ParE family toxin [Pistricoccus aurantiacus]|uniref:Type II toxin-antitoxin system RelE/ParE family toxin n=2 Tax=Pistricoccus aurantiacus TaxID=1883414 RepID=A0A5B8SU86_9GAMM|nr:type II toxin-antitoxin system RelE/ParE family toxin [Pistricoccus aurantiacus]
MPHLKWSTRSLNDMQRLHRFLAYKDQDAASRAIKSIRYGVRVLAHQPQAGRPIDDMEPEYREWLIDFGNSGYIVRYRIDNDTIILLAIRHQKEADF